MTDPRERIAQPAEEIAISRPTIEVPAKLRPPPQRTEARHPAFTRSSLRNADLEKIAALLRGGACWEDARTVIPNVSPAIVEKFKEVIVERAAQPGPAEKLLIAFSVEEERELLDAWVEAQRAERNRTTVRRSTSRCRR